MAVMRMTVGAAMPQGGSAGGAVEAVDAVASLSLSQPARPRRISVVVPTFKRHEGLMNCLRALLAQTLPPQDWELLVVDDGHDRDTRRAVVALAAQHPAHTLRYLQPAAGRGSAVARNTGWRAAASPLIAFTDDDTEPRSDWLAEGLHAMEGDPSCWALGGRVVVVPRPQGGPSVPSDQAQTARGGEDADFVTANAFVRRDVLQRMRGFDERFAGAWCGDRDFEFRLERGAGRARVRRCEGAVVMQPVRRERWGDVLRQQKSVFYDALLYRKHARLYRQRIQRRPQWTDFVIVAGTLAVLPLLLAGQVLAAALAGALPVALVLAFAARRQRATPLSPPKYGELLATSALIPFLSMYWRLRGAWHFKVPFL